MVITELAAHPAVAHSVYIAAILPAAGQSLGEILGGELPPWVVDRGDGTIAPRDDPELVREALFADLDPGAARQAHARFLPQSAAAFFTPSSAPPRAHPFTYVLCAEDRALPIAAQEEMAAGADHTVRLATAHCPQVTAPERVADALAAAVERGVGSSVAAR